MKSLRLFIAKDFYKGVVFDLIIFILGIGIVLYQFLLIPLDPSEYARYSTSVLYWMMGIVTAATALWTRNAFVILMRKDRTEAEDEADRRSVSKIMVLLLALPVIVYAIAIPWMVAGLFDDGGEDGGWPFPAFLPLLLFLTMLLGVICAGFVIFPIESTIRGVARAVRTRGREMGQLIIGAFGLVVLTFILVATTAIDLDNAGPLGSAQALLAIFGIPGGYEVTNEALLWVMRALFAVFIISLLIGRLTGFIKRPEKKNADSEQQSSAARTEESEKENG